MPILKPTFDRPHSPVRSRRLLHKLATLILMTVNLTGGICHVLADNSAEKSPRPNILLIVGDDKYEHRI